MEALRDKRERAIRQAVMEYLAGLEERVIEAVKGRNEA
jgi:hypothetical protein